MPSTRWPSSAFGPQGREISNDAPDRELATLLASLRYWQQDLARAESQLEDGPISPHFNEHTPLTVEEIDALCERLNSDGIESRFEALCRKVAESAESWADCSNLREAVAVFKALGRDCREQLANQGAPEEPSVGYVLYDFDERSLVTTTVFDNYQEAADAADCLSNVLVTQISVSPRIDKADKLLDDGGPCACELPGTFCSGVPGILAHVENGRLVPGTKVERCDACERYPSDQAALEKLLELGIALPSDEKASPA
jgi:hypothetical protein